MVGDVRSPAVFDRFKMSLEPECARPTVSVQGSTVYHEKAENGLFRFQKLGEKDVFRPYYGSLLYARPEKKSQGTDRYGKMCKEVTAESFRL